MSIPLHVGRASALAALGLVLWLVLTVAAAGSASAHAGLTDTDPGDGEVLAESPDAITLTFNEPVTVVGGATSVLDAEGTPVSVSVEGVNNTVTITPEDALVDGSYIVSWRVISTDSHPITGGFVFSVGSPSDTIIDVTFADAYSDRTVTVLLRSIDTLRIGSLLIVAGLLFFMAAAIPRQAWRVTELDNSFTRLVWWATGILATSSILVLPLDVAWSQGRELNSLASFDTWIAGLDEPRGMVVALSLIGITMAIMFWLIGRPALMVTAAAAGVSAGALIGHTRTYGEPFVTAASDVVHLATAAIWLGGLVGLVVTLRVLPHAHAQTAAEVVRRFSTLALATVAALVLSGVVLVSQIPGLTPRLPEILYDRILLAKVALVVVAVGIAAWNRYRFVPRLDNGHDSGQTLTSIRRTILAEGAVIAIVISLTAVLIAQVPRSIETTAVTSHIESAEFNGGTITVEMTPGTLGINAIEVEILDDEGEPIEPFAEPELSLILAEFDIGPLERPLSPVAPGRYTATADFGVEGVWTLRISVRVSEFSEPVTQIEVEIS